MARQNFFPLVWDSTQLAEFKACDISAFLRYILHMNGETSVDLVAGGAFAKGVHVVREQFYTHKESMENALAIGIEALREEYSQYYLQYPSDNKSEDRMALALEAYFNEYDLRFEEVKPLELENGQHSLEYNLMSVITDLDGEPILHPTLGIPLLFNGRLDMLAEYIGDRWFVDEKTTGSYFNKNWAKTWDMRDQFTAYCWLARDSGIPELANLSKGLIRGVSLPVSTATNYDTKQRFYGDIANIKFMQAAVSRNDFMIQNWRKSMVETILRAKERYLSWSSWENSSRGFESIFNHFSPNGGNHCVAYGRACSFTEVCSTRNGEKYLNLNEQHIWRPDLAKRQPLDEFLVELKAMQEKK